MPRISHFFHPAPSHPHSPTPTPLIQLLLFSTLLLLPHQVLHAQSPSHPPNSPHPGFHSEWQDPHLNLHRVRARYYQPQSSTFISRDPAPGTPLHPSTFHPYSFTANDPINRTDPSGRADYSLKSFLAASTIAGALSALDTEVATRGTASKAQITSSFLTGAAGGAVGYVTAPVFLAFGVGGRFALGSIGLAAASAGVAESIRSKNDLLAVYRGTVFGILSLAAIHDPSIKVYRVEGDPNTRILISPAGDVSILGNRMLFLNFGQRGRAEQFLAQKQLQQMPGAHIKSFEMPQSYLDDLRSRSVDESMANAFPDAPIRVDLTKAPDQYGIRSVDFDALIQSVIQGSGQSE